jgi:hypothetical protein
MRPRVRDLDVASEAEVDEIDAAARAHLDDPRTLVNVQTHTETQNRRQMTTAIE